MTACDPSSLALLIAIVMPRSLNDPVGLAPSTFRCTSHPVISDSARAGTSGVAPSRSVTTGVAEETGSRSRYSSISPRHPGRAATLVTTRPSCASGSLDPHDRGNRPHHVEASQLLDDRLQRGVASDVRDDDE